MRIRKTPMSHPHNYMDEARDMADYYGEPQKQPDGTWWFLDREGYPAAQVECEKDVARLETALLRESLQSLREARKSLNRLEDIIFLQKQAMSKREDEILDLIHQIK
jgi:hypothetical protein